MNVTLRRSFFGRRSQLPGDLQQHGHSRGVVVGPIVNRRLLGRQRAATAPAEVVVVGAEHDGLVGQRPFARQDGHHVLGLDVVARDELLHRTAVEQIGFQAGLDELPGDVVGRQIEPLGPLAAPLQLVGGQIAGRIGDPFLDGRDLFFGRRPARQRRQEAKQPDANREATTGERGARRQPRSPSCGREGTSRARCIDERGSLFIISRQSSEK